MFISGIGRTKFGISNKTLPELLYEAIYAAVKDSSLSINSIDLIIVANFLAGNTQNQLHLGSVISSLLPGINRTSFRVESACASGGMAIYLAQQLVDRYSNILVVGGEKLNSDININLIKNIALAGDLLRDQSQGLIFPAQYSFIASQYQKRYDLKHDDLALISLKNYANANLNPLAHFYYKNITLDLINSSPWICSHLKLYDCCAISDGASAVVISRDRVTNRDIELIGSGANTDAISLSQRQDFTSFISTKIASKDAYDMAKVTPKEIDIAEVHDCFTIAELVAMEDLGFCKKGTAANHIRDEETMLSGILPINTDGGLLGDGHPVGATGIAQICELVTQLRGEAGKRQIRNAKTGLSHNVGGAGGTAVVHILRGSGC